jgi:hypothetical protein
MEWCGGAFDAGTTMTKVRYVLRKVLMMNECTFYAAFDGTEPTDIKRAANSMGLAMKHRFTSESFWRQSRRLAG